MVHLCEHMFQRRRPFLDPLWDVTKLSTLLFGMDFERDFLEKCEYEYGWYFANLFPALYDGSFYSDPIHGTLRGQQHLLGFATFLCGVFIGNDQYRTDLNVAFERSLFNDGYRFSDGKLGETEVDTETSPELLALPNRTTLVRDISTALQNNEPLAILFIDLDHFKDVNDRLGHAAGNECLTTIAQVMATTLRRKGKLYRVGGDEFCAMLPNFSTSEAGLTAERVRTAIDSLKPIGGVVKVTASIGVAGSDTGQASTTYSATSGKTSGYPRSRWNPYSDFSKRGWKREQEKQRLTEM